MYKFRPSFRVFLAAKSFFLGFSIYFLFVSSFSFCRFFIYISKKFSPFSFERYLIRRFYQIFLSRGNLFSYGCLITISFNDYNTIFFLYNEIIYVYIKRVLNENFYD